MPSNRSKPQNESSQRVERGSRRDVGVAHRSRFEKYNVETVDRNAIQGAPYNPRQIDAHAKKKLRENIQKTGLLAPIIVNRRSGFVVSGHQRLTALDTLEKTDQYQLQVAYVDLTPKQEREVNIFMNNESAQGSWDLDALKEMIEVDNIDVLSAGFEESDLKMMLPDWKGMDAALADEPDDNAPRSEEESDIEAQAERIRKIKQTKKEGLAKAREADDTEFFLCIVFRDRKHLDSYMDRLHIDRREKYLSPDKMEAAVRELVASEEQHAKGPTTAKRSDTAPKRKTGPAQSR